METKNFNDDLIQAPLDRARKIISSLKVDETTRDMITRAAEEKLGNFNEPSVYRGWMNHVLSRDPKEGALKAALEDPDSSYMNFAFAAIDAPDEPYAFVVEKLIDRFGLDFIMPLHKIRWPREIEWAKRLQNHPNDEICFLANFFVEVLRGKGASKVFMRMAEFAHNSGIQTSVFETEIDLVEVDEIRNFPVASMGMDRMPISILFARNWFKMDSNPMPKPELLAKRADYIRQRYRAEYNNLRKMEMLKYLEKYPFIYQHMTVLKLIDDGFTSNATWSLYQSFLKTIEDDQVMGSINELELEFCRFVALHKDRASQAPDFDKAKSGLVELNVAWLESLPATLKELGGEERKKFSRWRDLILSKNREFPNNLILDYYFFLIETR